MKYYERINKSENEGIAQLEKSYEELKTRVGVIVGNDEEGEFLLVPTEMLGNYVVTCVSKADVRSKGFDVAKVTDEQMVELAEQLESDLVEYGNFWDTICDTAEDWGLPRIHIVVESDYGEACIEPSSDGDGYYDVNIGDNFDDYVGTIILDDADLQDMDKLIAEVNSLFKDEAE